jgi:hypothetical protein
MEVISSARSGTVRIELSNFVGCTAGVNKGQLWADANYGMTVVGCFFSGTTAAIASSGSLSRKFSLLRCTFTNILPTANLYDDNGGNNVNSSATSIPICHIDTYRCIETAQISCLTVIPSASPSFSEVSVGRSFRYSILSYSFFAFLLGKDSSDSSSG